MSAVQWGTVSTWVAAVGTVTAVSLALWETRKDRKERLRRELRQQAERISAWFVGMHKDTDGGGSHDEDPPREAWLPPELRGRYGDVELLNNSAEPVTEVLVFLSRVSYKVKRWWDQEPEYRVMIGVLPPGRWTISVPESGGAIAQVKLGGSAAVSRVMVITSFTDSAGNHWAREPEENYGSYLAPRSTTGSSTWKTSTGWSRPDWIEQRASGAPRNVAAERR